MVHGGRTGGWTYQKSDTQRWVPHLKNNRKSKINKQDKTKNNSINFPNLDIMLPIF